MEFDTDGQPAWSAQELAQVPCRDCGGPVTARPDEEEPSWLHTTCTVCGTDGWHIPARVQ